MTVTWKINCNKWKKIIGIILWTGATIGLGCAVYDLITNVTFENNDQTCIKTDSNQKECHIDDGFSFNMFWIFTILANGGNTIAIWLVINNHFKLLKIECTKETKITYD